MTVPPFIVHCATPKADRTKAFVDNLAQIIMHRWKQAGHPEVVAWAEHARAKTRTRSGELESEYIYVIKSNLVNGLPPKLMQKAAA